MKLKNSFRALTSVAMIAALGGTFAALGVAQSDPQQSNAPQSNPAPANRPAETHGGPPKFLNMVHQELKPGRSGAYDEQETAIARSYSRDNIPVFWIALASLTGPSEVLYLNLFDSSEGMAKAMDSLNAALSANPKLKQAQDRLLQENVSSETTVLAVRRDDMGYRVHSVEFAKMRILRVTTIFSHPGYERAFTQAEWALSEASEKANVPGAWAVYEVIAGLPEPAFVVVTPMHSLKEVDDANRALKKQGGAAEEYLQELARIAYGASDTQLFAVRQKASNVSRDFAARDPEFWTAVTAPEPPSKPSRNSRSEPSSRGAGAHSPKP